MSRKSIIVPKDQEAMQALDYDTATPDQLHELPLTDTQFATLWRNNIFDRINKEAGTLIDDFEDASITDADILEKIASGPIFDQKPLNPKTDAPELNGILQEIKNLFRLAIEYKTGVFFYL